MILGACGTTDGNGQAVNTRSGSDDAEQSASAGMASPSTVPCQRENRSFTFIDHGINTLVHSSVAAVVGTWEKVPVPTASGEDVAGEPTLRVDAVVFDSADLELEEGDTVTVRLLAADSCSVESYEPYAGPVHEGTRALVLLERVKTADGGGALTFTWLTNWRVEADENGQQWGRNAKSERDAPLDTIVSRLRAERDAGKSEARDKGTEQRPFD